MATVTVLFAKSTIHLLSTTLFENDNQYDNIYAWIITGVTVITAVSQVYSRRYALLTLEFTKILPRRFTGSIWAFSGTMRYCRSRCSTLYGLFLMSCKCYCFGIAS
jgi:hypothetical protein